MREASVRQAVTQQSRDGAGRNPRARADVRPNSPLYGDGADEASAQAAARRSGPSRGVGRRSLWGRFVRRWGWRAYALPILIVLTIFALLTTRAPHTATDCVGGTGALPTASGPAMASPSQQVKSDDPGAGSVDSVLPALQLPPGPAYTVHGAGTYSTVPGSSAVIGRGPVRRFSIEIENGVTGVNLQQFAATVMTALSSPQSWIADGSVGLQRVDSGPVDFHVTLVSSMTVRQLCGYSLPLETSCFAADKDNRVVLNVARWMRGAKAYAGDLATYRLYAVNHEVGHAIGHNHSHECLAGGLAPVMMQQTIGTKTASGTICQPNPWPYPRGAKDAPGREEAGDAPDLQFFKINAS